MKKKIGSPNGYSNATLSLISLLCSSSLCTCSLYALRILSARSSYSFLSLSNFSRVILSSSLLMSSSFRLIFSRLVVATCVSSVIALKCLCVPRTASFALSFSSHASLLSLCRSFSAGSSGLCLSPVTGWSRGLRCGDPRRSSRLAPTSGWRSSPCIEGERTRSCQPNPRLLAGDA